MNNNPIVVGIDGSLTGAQALAWAASEAERTGLPLVIAHIGDSATRTPLSQATVVTVLKETGEFGNELLQDALTTVIKLHPDVAASTFYREGHPADYLLDLATSAHLVVLGTHGENRMSAALLGSVSQRVAAHASCPVVVVAQQAQAVSDRGRVVVGVSQSAGGETALRFAFREAEDRGAVLVAVRGYGVFGRSNRAQLYGPLKGLQQHEGQVLKDTVAAVRPDYPGVTVELRLIDEPPYDALPKAAADADLLVVGCHRDDDSWPSRLGPVASLLLHRSPCPIAVVGKPHVAATSAGT